MSDVKLFEYAVILQPKKDKEGEIVEEAEVVVDPTTALAKDDKQAALIAGRAIPDKFMEMLDRLTVIVRPF